MRAVLLAAQIAATASISAAPANPPLIAAHLRGSEPSAAEPAEAIKPRGRFYNADGCEDCVYKGAQCGCQPSMEYFACLTKHCGASNGTKFADKCAQHGNECFGELDIDCHGPDTICKSKFYQLPEGGVGLSLDLEHAEDDAYCGPWGKCMGEIHMKVNIHRFKKPAEPADKAAAAVSPAPATAPAPAAATAPAPAPAAAAIVEEKADEEVWVECGLPKVSNADVDVKEDWYICEAQAKGDKGACDIPMFASLKAEKGKKGYCLLKDKAGKRLTQPAYHLITNVHDEVQVPAQNASAEPKKAAPAEPKAEAPKEMAHADSGLADTDTKLPWMKDKEARQAEAAAEAKKAPPVAKAEAKPVPKSKAPETLEAAAKQIDESNDGRPPWMQDKKSDKAPPPGAEVVDKVTA